MSYESTAVAPISPRIGAEVSGVDLSRPLGNQQFQELHDALAEHQLLFFRDQDRPIWTATRRWGGSPAICASIRLPSRPRAIPR